MLIKDLQGKRITIWGMGTEGQSVKEYLEKHKIPAALWEYNDADGNKKLDKLLEKTDIIIRSPGVSIYKDEVKKAKVRGIQFTSSSDLFLNEMLTNHPQTQVIGISGSKGKSTSVSMLYHILKSFGCKVALGGNIGKPLIDLIDEKYDFVVGEFSSYQASDLTASPQIVMFTNLFSVHTDWHRGHENYCLDKMHLAAYQKNGDICFVNDRNEQLKHYAKVLRNVCYYDVKEGFHAEGRDLYYGTDIIANIKDFKFSGNHNLDNLSGVLSIIKYLGFDIRLAINFLKSFEPLPHRLQKVATIDDVLFINDSISTAPEAAIGGMKSFDDRMAIISGGIENQQDYTEYAKYIQDNPKVKVAVTLFQCGKQIADAIKTYVTRKDFVLIEAESLEEGVEKAFIELKKVKGTLILFSPTAPSFGYYKNFMERGEHFIKIVKNLEKNNPSK